MTKLYLNILGSHRARRSTHACVASPVCTLANQSSSDISFTSSPCSTPIVDSISPNQGTYHQDIHIQGHGFGNVSCAIEVMYLWPRQCISIVFILSLILFRSMSTFRSKITQHYLKDSNSHSNIIISLFSLSCLIFVKGPIPGLFANN